jgi:protein dithiol oxidoreductase (disulfide-forming)
MNRRHFHFRLAALGALAALPPAVRAQGGPVEGKDFIRVASPVAMPPGKIEVVEFFGYWCPHCNAFEPTLDAWVHKVPADVAFRRVPVAFQPWQEPYQKLYYAIESLGLVDALHRRAFAAIHVGKQRLEKDADIIKWATDNGQDGAKIVDAMKSFSTSSKMRQGAQLATDYHIDGVPTLGIHGRFMTSPGTAGSQERALQITDQLVAQIRAGAKKG